MLRTLLKRIFSKKPPMLRVGVQAPDFEARDHLGRAHRLSALRGQRVALWFYPRADTPGCTKEACGFRDVYAEYQAKGIAVLAVSVDPPEMNRAFAEKYRLAYPLLCDTDRRISLAYKACDSATDAWARRYTYLIGADGRIERAIDTKDAAGQAAELLERL